MRILRLLLSAALFTACGGASETGGTTAPTQPTQPTQPTVATVVVTIAATSLEAGSTTTALAAPLDQNHATLSGKTASWTSDNTSVATVTSAGVITGVAPGTTNIIASVDGIQGRAPITIVTSTKWSVDATVLTNADYGGVVGSLADVAVVKLNDGRYRMFIGGVPTGAGIASAISSDGIKFTTEAGLRIPGSVFVTATATARLSHPFVMRLDDGRLRLYAHSAPGLPDMSVFSFTSADEGLTFTLDPGVRLLASAARAPNITGSAIVKVKTGGWRMYFSASTAGTTSPSGFVNLGTDWILSAFSTDLLTWTPDAGVRVGPGSSALPGNAVHPGAIANDDGSVTLAYFRSSPGSGLYTATSADGLVFPTESATLFTAAGLGYAADPFLMRLSNGDVRMFYNWGDDKTGTIYTAHRSAFTLSGK